MNIRTMAAAFGAGAMLLAGVAYAQSTPVLWVGFAVSDTVAPGAGKTIATIELNGLHSSSAARVASVPVNAVGVAANFTNCRVTTTADLNTSLTSGTHTVQSLGTLNTFVFDTPVVIPAGVVKTFAVRCDVSSLATVGSTLMLSVTPASVSATDDSGNPITPVVALDPYGAPRSMNGTLSIRAIGTPGAPNTGSTPGAPNTGAGGDAAANIAIILASALVALIGSDYLRRSRRRR